MNETQCDERFIPFKASKQALLALSMTLAVANACSDQQEDPEPTTDQEVTDGSGSSDTTGNTGGQRDYVIAPPELPSIVDWQAPEECGPATMPVIGQDECMPVGDDCPDGQWPVDSSGIENAVYVQPGGTGDGTSTESPLGSINEAVSGAAAGAVVVLAKGDYAESVVLSGDITLRGTCAAETAIGPPEAAVEDTDDASEDSTKPSCIVIESGPSVSLANLQVSGDCAGIQSGTGVMDISMEGVWVHDTVGFGIKIEGVDGNVSLNRVAASFIAADPDAGWGVGIRAYSTTALTLTDIYIHSATRFGLDLSDVGEGAHDGVVVTHTQPTLDPSGAEVFGMGVILMDSHITGGRVWAENNHWTAFMLMESTSGNRPLTGGLSDVVAKNTRYNFDVVSLYEWAASELGFGAMLWGGTFQLTRLLVEGNHSVGVASFNSPYPCTQTSFCGKSELTLVDTTIVQTKTERDGRYGMGISVADGGQVLGSRVSVDGNHYVGIAAFGDFHGVVEERTTVDLTDVKVSNTSASHGADGEPGFGDGVVASYGATVTLERFDISTSERVGILIGAQSFHGDYATGKFTDGVVRNNLMGVVNLVEELNMDEAFDNVVVENNDVNTSTTDISVPTFSVFEY